MIQITMKEHINGFTIEGFDFKKGESVISEIQEERIEALKTIKLWVDAELRVEYERRLGREIEM